MATSEEEIVVNSDLCAGTDLNYMKQIRADFTVCSLPADSLTGTCISGAQNEHDECGYGSNLLGFCQYCASSSANSTDTCCINSNAASRCQHVPLPTTTTTLQPLIPSSTGAASSLPVKHGLSGGQIAGIVVGSVAGFALLVALILVFILLRRRRRTPPQNVLNQPNPQRKGAPPAQYPMGKQGYEIVPGGRVARMSALQEAPSRSPSRSRTPAAIYGDSSESEARRASPGAMSRRIPPVTGRRHGSLSSSSVFAGVDSDASPRSGAAGQYSSPDGLTSSQSEQLPYFRDYYSQDDIHPGDKVAVLWAYQPRAGDEFELDRGDMLKVIGIWDDGWATGVRLPERAEDYDARRLEQRDSGVSNGSRRATASPPSGGEIKAFPLVCVCLPQHWSKIVEGDGQEYDGSP